MNNFVPERGFNKENFKGSCLIVPAVSIGNVPQLAVDLLITTLNLKRVGFIEDDSIVSVSGAREDTTEGTGSSDQQLTVIQQRAPAHKGKSHQYARNLVTFFKECHFSRIILLASADAKQRRDVQLTGDSFRILTTDNLSPDVQSRISSLDIKTLETPDVEEDYVKPQAHGGYPRIVGGGMSNYLLSLCKEEKLALIVLILFAMEGGNVTEDNVHDATLTANKLTSLLSEQGIQSDTCFEYAFSVMRSLRQDYLLLGKESTRNWISPRSWNGLFGKPFEQELY
ncbi:3988_t:CDS:2 [Paraglomus occultum]|uniref:Proteasome assembly chaperone 2 n=1 Tax=Paraglomus occultum TaxID=144539 RepID=A0A9N9G0B1_9GLOM|nr:3988_t:CDS:2 [Paraglomus occultum]